MTIDASHSGQQIEMKVGQDADLKLAENPTTGYRWTVASEGRPACRLEDLGFQGGEGPPGRGGEHVWRLEAVSAGDCELRLVYVRGASAASPGDRAFALRVQVTQ